MSAQLLTWGVSVSSSTRQVLQIFPWLQFTYILQPGPVAFRTERCTSSLFPGKAFLCTGLPAASWLCLLFQGRLLWMGKQAPFFFPVLPCHIMTDSLTSLSLGHMTYFDCIFLTNLAMYLVSFPEGELGQNPWILRVSRSIWKEEENQRCARKRQAEKDERIWRREVFALGMKLPPGWPKAEQFTLFCNMQNGPAPNPRSKHFKGAWGAPYLYFYKLLGLLGVSGYIPIASIAASLKWGSALWRYLG